MNINDLKYFHQLAIQKNFSRVADYFGVRQPTITMAVKRLEKQYGLPLILRDKSHQALELTGFGRQFDRHAEIILRELDLAEKEARHTKLERVRFGLPPIIGNYYFPALVPNLLKCHLLARLQIIETGSNETLKLVNKGDVDMALLGSLEEPNQVGLAASTIATSPFGILVSKKSPLAAAYSEGVYFSELKRQKFIGLNERFIHNQAFHQVAARAHVRPKVIYRTADVHVLGSLVAEGIGVAFLTALAANINPGAVLLPLLDDRQPLFYISKVRRSQTLLEGYQKELWDQLG